MTFTDKLGHTVAVGEFIAYGHALGRCAGLRIGRVVDIKPRKLPYSTEPGFSIAVRGVSDDWASNEPKLCSRVGTLLYPNRILKLDSLPDMYRKLLEVAGV